MKAEQKQGYAQKLQEMLNATQKSKGQVHIAVLSTLGIDPPLYD